MTPKGSTAEISNWKRRLPMQLTWARIASAAPIIALIYAQDAIYLGAPEGAWCGYLACLVFILSSITDWFDGALARKYGAVSNMGKFMDPIADKILVSSVLIMLIPSGRVGPIVVLLLLIRDILVGGIRSVAAADNVVIDAKQAGKWKTGLQMTGIPMLLFHVPLFGVPLREIGYGLLWLSVVLSVISGAQYTRIYLESRRTGPPRG